MKRPLLLITTALAAAWVWWTALVRRTGDSFMVWGSERLADIEKRDGTIAGTVPIENRGNALGVVRRVEGRVLSGGHGRVVATRAGSRPPERGWWVSNILLPGESCRAEIEVVLEGEESGPLVLELTVQEMGRRVFQYRTVRVRVQAPDVSRGSP